MTAEYYLDDEQNPILYHYCKADAFESILRTRSLLLRQLSVMNDRLEHRWLKHITYKRLRLRTVMLPNDGHAMKHAKMFDTIEHHLRHVRHDDPFCVCFSEDGDLLSQWRAYAGDGSGFAIGFQMKSLFFADDTFPWKVLYGIKLQKQLVDELIDEALFSGENGGADHEKLAEEFHDRLLTNSLCCKNPAFREEKEWRVIYNVLKLGLLPLGSKEEDKDFVCKLKSKFFVVGSELRHHLILPFQPSFGRRSVVTIRLGPKNPSASNRQSIRRFLDAKGYSHVRILESKASYR